MSFLKSFAKFSVGTWISAGIAIVSTPIITWFIKPEEFGKSAMFILAYSLIINLLSFSIDQGFIRYFNEKKAGDRPALLGSSLILPILGAFVGILGVEIFKYDLLILLFSSKEDIYIVRLLQFAIPIGILAKFTNASLRMQQKASYYSIVQVATGILSVVITLCYAYYISSSFYAILFGFVISQLGGLILSFIFDFKFWKLALQSINSIDKNIINLLFIYSVPFIPIFLIDWLFQGLDRTFLRAYSNFSEIGLYATATKISYSLNIIQSGFTTFWVPFSYEKYQKDPENKSLYSIVFNTISLSFGILILIILVFQKLIVLVIAREYADVVNIFPVLLLIPMLYTLSEITVVGINFKKKTKMHLYIIIGSVVVNGLFAFALVEDFGALGAAISMAFGYLSFFILRTFIAKKYYDVNINLMKLSFTMAILLIPILLSMINFIFAELVSVICFGLLILLNKAEIINLYRLYKNKQLPL